MITHMTHARVNHTQHTRFPLPPDPALHQCTLVGCGGKHWKTGKTKRSILCTSARPGGEGCEFTADTCPYKGHSAVPVFAPA